MQRALYSNRFGSESLVCTVLVAFWSDGLNYAGNYLERFVVFATYCLDYRFSFEFKIYFRVVAGVFGGYHFYFWFRVSLHIV